MNAFTDTRSTISRQTTPGSAFTDGRPTNFRYTTIGSRPSSLGVLNQDIWSLEPFSRGSVQADPDLGPETSEPMIADSDPGHGIGRPTSLRIHRRPIPESPPRSSTPPSSPDVFYPIKPHALCGIPCTEIVAIQENSYTKRICLDENCPIESMHSADRVDLDRLAKGTRLANIPADVLADNMVYRNLNSNVPKEILEALERIKLFKETKAYRTFKKDEEFLEGCRRVHHRWGY